MQVARHYGFRPVQCTAHCNSVVVFAQIARHFLTSCDSSNTMQRGLAKYCSASPDSRQMHHRQGLPVLYNPVDCMPTYRRRRTFLMPKLLPTLHSSLHRMPRSTHLYQPRHPKSRQTEVLLSSKCYPMCHTTLLAETRKTQKHEETAEMTYKVQTKQQCTCCIAEQLQDQ